MSAEPADVEVGDFQASRNDAVLRTIRLDEGTMPLDLRKEVPIETGEPQSATFSGGSSGSDFVPKSKSTFDRKFWKSSSMLVSDLWAPVPMGITMALNVIKDLKQSVSEVMRVLAFEVHIPQEIPLQGPSIKVTIEGVSARKCQGCRRQRPQVFQTYQLSLHLVAPGVYRTKETNCDCRISRLQRRAHQINVVVRVYGRFEGLGEKRPKSIARLSAKVPVFLGGNAMVRVDLNATKVNLPKAKGIKSASLSMSSSGDITCSKSNSRTSSYSSNGKSATLHGHCRLSVLEAFQVFDVKRCRPTVIRALGHDEWRPGTTRQWKAIWKSPFAPVQLQNPAAILATMTADMKHDVILMYQTLFSMCAKSSAKKIPLSADAILNYNRRILFLKRLYLCFAVCKLTYCDEENGAATHAWPFPLASALCHGGRILMRLDGVHWKEFTNFLLFGDSEAHDWDEGGVPGPMWARWAATHAVGLHERTSQLYEQKLTLTKGLQNLEDGMKAKHLGLDLPVGGFTNIAPTRHEGKDTMFIGPSGVPYRMRKVHGGRQLVFAEEVQHGHLYFRWDDFGNTMVPVLENNLESTPTMEESRDTCVTGGRKGVSFASEETSASDAAKTIATQPKEKWLQMPHFSDLDQLIQILKDYGYHHLAGHDAHRLRLFKHLVENSELSITANEQGTKLRCRGVVIHLVIETEEDGVEKVLLQRSVSALADPEEPDDPGAESPLQDSLPEDEYDDPQLDPAGLRTGASVKSYVSLESSYAGEYEGSVPEVDRATHELEDIRVPTMLRRRHESWTEAVTRICESWDLPPKAIALLIDQCREAEEEMCIYKCERPVSHCYHHGEYTYEDDGCVDQPLDIEYQAYRFKFFLKPKDRHLFQSLVGQDKFVSTERGMPLEGFAGHQDALGSIFRKWEWVPRTQASMHAADGLFPPDDRINIVRETDHLSAILLGIENSAPHKENFFGGKHTAAATNQETSPFGTRKWKDYRNGGQEVPADIGGMHMSVDATAFKALQRLCKKVKLSDPYDGYTTGPAGKALRHEKDLFKELLQSSDEQVGEVLFRRFRFIRPVLHGHAGTMVFDAFVRDRTSVENGDATVSPMLPPNGSSSLQGEHSGSDLDFDSSDDEEQTDKDEGGETLGDRVSHILEQGGNAALELQKVIAQGGNLVAAVGVAAGNLVTQRARDSSPASSSSQPAPTQPGTEEVIQTVEVAVTDTDHDTTQAI